MKKDLLNNFPDFEVHKEGKYPIIYRQKGNELTDACPFCGKQHRHGIGEGHRIAHCPAPGGCTLSDGTYVPRNKGYILREY